MVFHFQVLPVRLQVDGPLNRRKDRSLSLRSLQETKLSPSTGLHLGSNLVFDKKVGRRPTGRMRRDNRGKHFKKNHEYEQAEADAEYLLSRLVPKGGSVLDCCCGSGTTLVVSSRLELTAIGIDCDPSVLAMIRARLGCFTPSSIEALG